VKNRCHKKGMWFLMRFDVFFDKNAEKLCFFREKSHFMAVFRLEKTKVADIVA
jgi:hypothetical protein